MNKIGDFVHPEGKKSAAMNKNAFFVHEGIKR